MGTFNGFTKQDFEFFANMPSENMSPEHHVTYYQKNRDTARNIDNEFRSIFKDIDIFLRINFKSKYKWKAKRLSQGFGKRFKYIWGAFYTSKEIRHQDDIQLFMEFGLFFNKQVPAFNVGISLQNIADKDRYYLYRDNLKSNSKKIELILKNSENKYIFWDDEDRPISGEMDDVFTQWIELPGSVFVELQNEKEILDSSKLIEKVKSVMNDLYPILYRVRRTTKMLSTNNTNIFRYYSQAENRYTSGLVSLLKIGSIVDHSLLENFFETLAGVKLLGNINLKVLREYDGTADAEILSRELIILLETKVVSGTLRKEQIKRHFFALKEYQQKNKKLILLTPDSVGSHYVNQFLEIAPNKIIHINWNSVISFLLKYQSKDKLFSELIRDYIEEIKEQIFEQDIAAVIVKIRFGNESKVYRESYLDEFRNGEWNDWHTRNKCDKLDGKGKKLILYDKYHGLILEVEIEKVRKTNEESKYPWSNKFVKNSLRMYNKPIPLSIIKKIPDKDNKFKNFDRCQTWSWNLTRQQYEWLMERNGK